MPGGSAARPGFGPSGPPLSIWYCSRAFEAAGVGDEHVDPVGRGVGRVLLAEVVLPALEGAVAARDAGFSWGKKRCVPGSYVETPEQGAGGEVVDDPAIRNVLGAKVVSGMMIVAPAGPSVAAAGAIPRRARGRRG